MIRWHMTAIAARLDPNPTYRRLVPTFRSYLFPIRRALDDPSTAHGRGSNDLKPPTCHPILSMPDRDRGGMA